MLLRIINGSVTIKSNTILESINFEIKDSEKVAIVGRNGCGKTTFIKSIIGDIELEEGIGEEKFQFILSGNPSIGYISQKSNIDPNITLMDAINNCYKDIICVYNKINEIEKELEFNYSESLINKYNGLLEQYKYMGGYSYKKEYNIALSKFGFNNNDIEKKIGEFSLGQRTKISFMCLLLSKPDLLILDEPTNHLDIDTVLWLEDFLKNYSKSLIIVSHDRMFLDNVVSIVYDIEYGSLTRYSGNYSSFIEQKNKNYEKQLKDYEFQQKEIKRLNDIANRFRYKPTKASMALNKLKQIERMVKVDIPKESDNKTLKSIISIDEESYREALKIKNLVIGYDRQLGIINTLIERGDRVGIIGKNGSGKSTFLKTIIGDIKPISGKVIIGSRVKYGYFDQNMELMDNNNTVYEEFERDFINYSNNEIRNILGSFLFKGDDVFKKVSDLSGGERVRLLLCKIISHKPNLLILDEPTNHLDIIGKDKIESMLENYKGTIIFVSHDRYFIKRIANKLISFEDDGIKYYNYGYLEYLEKKKDSYYQACSNVNVNKPNIKYISAFKEKSKLEKKLKIIEDNINKLELKKNEYNSMMLLSDVYMDINKCIDIQNNIKKLDEEINILEEEWDNISNNLI